MTWRPSYRPQYGHSMCGGFGRRQARLEHSARVGAAVFHWARRERVFDRDILRLGTATLLVLLFGSAQPLLQCSPARVYCLMPVICTEFRPLTTAFGAQAQAIFPAQRSLR